MRVLSIIVTYNALQRDWLYKCLDSLTSSTQQTDIFVVDNNSQDDTVKVILDKFPHVNLHQSHTNLGFAKGNNIGFVKAIKEDYDFVFLLNQDAWISKNTLHEMIAAANTHTDFGILSPVHYNGEGNNLEELFSQFLLKKEGAGRKFYFDNICGEKLRDIYYLSYIHAACWLIPKRCYLKVGMFDDILFTQYGEDDNYISRVKFRGFKIGLVPGTYVYHDTEFRNTAKTKNNFDDSLLEFNVTGSNMMDPSAIKKVDLIIQKEKATAFYYLRRLNIKQFIKYRTSYKKKITQKEVILHRRTTY